MFPGESSRAWGVGSDIPGMQGREQPSQEGQGGSRLPLPQRRAGGKPAAPGWEVVKPPLHREIPMYVCGDPTHTCAPCCVSHAHACAHGRDVFAARVLRVLRCGAAVECRAVPWGVGQPCPRV